MQKGILLILLMVCFVFVFGFRERYDPAWKSVASNGIVYSDGMVTVNNAFNYAVDTASNDTYLASVEGITAYTTGLLIYLNPVTDNTGACTLNINSLGAKNIKDGLGGDPPNAHIDAAGITLLCYDGTNFVIINGDNNP